MHREGGGIPRTEHSTYYRYMYLVRTYLPMNESINQSTNQPTNHQSHLTDPVYHFAHMYDSVTRGAHAPPHQYETEARSVALRKRSMEKIGYAIEMFNFWGPLEPHPLMVHPLALRFEPDAPTDPTNPNGGYHTCPTTTDSSMPGEEEEDDDAAAAAAPIKLWFTGALEAGSGYLFKTPWVQHAGLTIADSDISEGGASWNCRTSAEFRFWLIGNNKPTPFRLNNVEDLTDPSTAAADALGRHKGRQGQSVSQ